MSLGKALELDLFNFHGGENAIHILKDVQKSQKKLKTAFYFITSWFWT